MNQRTTIAGHCAAYLMEHGPAPIEELADTVKSAGLTRSRDARNPTKQALATWIGGVTSSSMTSGACRPTSSGSDTTTDEAVALARTSHHGSGACIVHGEHEE